MMSTKEKAVVMISGGMDSALCIALAKEAGFDIAGLHINYGQRTENKELLSFNALATHYGIANKLVVDLRYLAKIGGSSLTDRSIEVTGANLKSKEIPTSYVPFRNANILCIATSWAEVTGATAVFIGAVEEDSSGYPDTRKDFFESFQEIINKGTKPGSNIRIHTPIINFSKAQIVKKGIELGVPFELTWSCYKSESPACGLCDSCALRLRGFRLAGYNDPLGYTTRPEY